MDTVTHALLGVFTYSLLPKEYKTKKLLIASPIVANIPDFDVLFSYSPELYLLIHRGITHSIFLIPILSFFISYILLRYCTEKASPWNGKTMYGYTLLLLLTHVYADIFTNYGTMALLPFSPERIRLNGLFIIDVVILAMLIIGSIAGFKGKRALGGVLASCMLMYPLFSLGIGYTVHTLVAQRYAPMLSKEAVVTVYPAPFAPLYWNIIIEDENVYYHTAINTITKKIPSLTEYPKLDTAMLAKLQETDSFFRTYIWFAEKRLVVAEEKEGEIVIAPLAYMPIEGALFGRKSYMFPVRLFHDNYAIARAETYATPFPWRSRGAKNIIIDEPIPFISTKVEYTTMLNTKR